MGVFAWRRRATRHFDEQWVPFAEISFRSTAGRWYPFSVQVDTGAVISVISRSAAELLGVDPERGEPIDLAGVGTPARRYFVHRLETRMEDIPEWTMRIAVAEHENVPNLLGRLDVLDRFQIDFDASLEETKVSLPWLNDGTRRIWRHFIDVEAEILRKWSEHPLPGKCDQAAKRFLNRAEQLLVAGAGLLKLHRDFELPLVLRSLFELSVQFEYLMRDPEPRAELYVEYEHVTQHRFVQAWVNLPGPVGDRLRRSPHREQGEERILAEYDRVMCRFTRKPGSQRVRRHWYPGTFRDLATELDRTEEYDAIYGLYSVWAHGDPWTARLLKTAHAGLMHLYTYWSRIMIQVADAKKIILSAEAYQSLVESAKGGLTQ